MKTTRDVYPERGENPFREQSENTIQVRRDDIGRGRDDRLLRAKRGYFHPSGT